MGPLDITVNYGTAWGYLVSLLIGIGFGASLESSGFGDSRILSSQFYFRDMRVLKVMLSAVITAMTFIFLFSSFELLDFTKINVNPTYLLPQAAGALLLGMGFVIGGFCPGTSVVAASTGKIDGMFFLGGVMSGAFLFGETMSLFIDFYNSFYMGRLILPEVFGVGTGAILIIILLLSFILFWVAEILEDRFNIAGEKPVRLNPFNRKTWAFFAALLLLSVIIIAAGQPGIEDRWEWISKAENETLLNRDVHVHPVEALEAMNDALFYTKLIDVREENDYNIFHLQDAKRWTSRDLRNSEKIKELAAAPSNTIIILMSNNEEASTGAYKLLKAQGIANLYILSGGINKWLDTFGVDKDVALKTKDDKEIKPDSLKYEFKRAWGETVYPANPGAGKAVSAGTAEFERKIKTEKKKVISGGCG